MSWPEGNPLSCSGWGTPFWQDLEQDFGQDYGKGPWKGPGTRVQGYPLPVKEQGTRDHGPVTRLAPY